jgi:hypothetical protein
MEGMERMEGDGKGWKKTGKGGKNKFYFLIS